MNDDELRAFLEGATTPDLEPDNKTAAEAAQPLTRPTAADQPRVDTPIEERRPTYQQPQTGLSFDELMGIRREEEPEVTPLVLPEPTRAVARDSGVTPLLLPSPTASAAPPAAPRPAVPVPPPTPATAAAPIAAFGSNGGDDLPPTQPIDMQREMSEASEPVAPVAARGVSQPIAATVPIVPVVPTPARPAASGLPMTAPNEERSIFDELISEPGDSEYEKIAVTGGSGEKKRFIPWIIVAGGAVVALIAAFFIVNAVRGGGEPEPVASPTTTQEQATDSSTPTPSDTPTQSQAPSEPTDEVPQVEVGPTMNMPVTHWGIQVDLSQKLGDTFYNISGENLVLTSSLISSLPASCSGEWGMTRVAGNQFEVLRPAERCAAAPELYDELWGLMDSMVKTVSPL